MIFSREYGNITGISPLTLAFIGDTVFDLYVRTGFVSQGKNNVNNLHKAASKVVCAKRQSEIIKELMPLLTEEEISVFKRGRNAHPGTTAKNQTSADYHYATGFEALLGYLYIKGEGERLEFLLSKIDLTETEVTV